MTFTDLEISVYDEAVVHVFEAEDHFGRVEANLFLEEDPVLRQVVVEVAPVHQVEDET